MTVCLSQLHAGYVIKKLFIVNIKKNVTLMNYKKLRARLEADESLTNEERTKLGKYIIRTEGLSIALQVLGHYKKQAD